MNAFFDMGGYGAYVWPAYAIVFAVLVVLFVTSWRRSRVLERQAAALKAASPRRRRRNAPAEAASEAGA